MIDVPCGDVNFQFSRWETDSLLAYVGLDIVPELVHAAVASSALIFSAFSADCRRKSFHHELLFSDS